MEILSMSENAVETDDLDTPVDEALLRGDGPVEEDAVEAKQEAEDEIPSEDGSGEDAVAAVEQPDPPDDKKHGTVTQERFNQVYAEAKALKEKVAALESAQPKAEEPQPQSVPDIKALRSQATQALFDGETDKYNELQDKIDAEILRRAEESAEARMEERALKDSFKSTVAEVYEKYPVLRDGSGNADAIQMVVALRDAKIAEGMSPSKALSFAADKVAPLFSAAPEKPQADETPADPRKEKAVLRGVKTNESIPPSDVGLGNRSQPPKPSMPSQTEWERMSQGERDKYLAA
jgi:hypothetical protein